MEAIDQLERVFFLLQFGAGDFKVSVDWAIERLLLDQEGDDLDIVLLAGATDSEEAVSLVRGIVERYGGPHVLDDQFAGGKYVASLHDAYLQGRECIKSLDVKFDKLNCNLDYPDWLTMLSRNCEYATDLSAFVEPFEQEFSYVAGLWSSSQSRSEFEAAYDRQVSNRHDVGNY